MATQSDSSSRPRTVASTINFSTFSTLCDSIATRAQAKKKEPLKSFLEAWRNEYKKLYPDNPQPPTETFFPIMRLLMPDADRDRPTYGIKEYFLAKLLIEEMGLFIGGDASSPAQQLIHWKKNKPQNANSADVSDFAGVAFFVLQNRTRKDGEISIEEVNVLLDELAMANTATGEEKKKSNSETIHSFFTRMNANELKWLIRIILKDLKVGVGHGTILDAFHPDARDLFDVTNSLSTVCLRLNDPNIRMSEIEISLNTFVRPMLSDNWKPEKLRVLLKIKNILRAEIKYDGERVQIHRQNNNFKYFSRGGHDISDVLGVRPDEGTLTQYIADCFRPDVTTFIIDGEICPYDIQEKCIATKAESTSIKSLTGETGYQVCFVAFDCLMYNQKTLTALPLERRSEYLQKLFQVEEGRLHHAVTRNVTTPEEVYDFLNEAVDQNEEGIILKDPTTVYKPNKRDAGWWKIKPEFVDSLTDTLDVLVVGGYYGTGRRSGPSHFLVAVAQTPEGAESGAEGTESRAPKGEGAEGAAPRPTKFLSLCKVGTGYTMEELKEMNKKLDAHWKPWTPSSQPKFLQLAPGQPKADLWVEPHNSFIVKIGAAQILDSDTFGAGCTLRFPRMKEARMDKQWFECMTLKELLTLKETSRGRLGARDVTDEQLMEGGGDGGGPRKRQKVGGRAAVLRVGGEFRPADLSDVEVTGNIFLGKEFCVASDAPGHSKQDLERLIAEKGGTCVQHPSPATFCVISQKKTVHVSNIFNRSPVDVILPSWLIRCTESNALLPWLPEDVLFATKRTRKMIKSAFDQYGDSFTHLLSAADFERHILEMNNQKIVERDKIAHFEEEHLQDLPLMGLFRLCIAYIDKFEVVGDSTSKESSDASLSLAEAYIISFGGVVTDTVDKSVTHVVVHSSDLVNQVNQVNRVNRLNELKRLNHDRKTKFHLVTEQWVLDSVEQLNIRDERRYMPRVPTTHTHPAVTEKIDVFGGLSD